jgi:hypothetical protein
MLRSEDSFAPFSQSNMRALMSKHPQAPDDRRSYANPAQYVSNTVAADAQNVQKAVSSFPAGSSGGPDGLTPQHLKDLFRLDGCSGPLAISLTALSNAVLQGFIPERIKSLLFSARLIAFTKKDGGVRPIAIGLTLRRLVAKLVVDQAMGVVKSSFQPVQLGVGVSRGLEAGIHAGRQFLNSLSPGHAMLKLDFANAFNTIRRDSLLECVSRVAPGI